MSAPAYLTELLKSLKIALTGTVLVDAVAVKYFTANVGNASRGIFLTQYQENGEDNKHKHSATVFFTIQCFDKSDSVEAIVSISEQVKNIVKASVTSTIELGGNLSATVTKSPVANLYQEQNNGITTHRCDIRFELLIDEI